MPLTPGTQIGPYEIVGWLGAGGMGEVYRARDSRLAREVAIKLIPETLASDRSRLHRFEQEARAAGQLNHPNILAVYDIGTHAGAPYIVSELLEGETLRSRLAATRESASRGAAASGGEAPRSSRNDGLSRRKAIDYARQIAEGLAAAHDKGIVHRDLKPDNLFLVNDGRIKILDFGIAKLTQSPDADPARETGLPTATDPGMVVGTVGYMSPEQVRGETVDHRSDVFNFGTILYEMLTGRLAFTRATAAETMVAILKEDPPEPLGTIVSPALARIVSRCLEKAREARFQSARDLAFALEMLSETHPVATPVEGPVDQRLRWLRHRALPWVVASVLALALAATAVWYLQPSPPLVTRLAYRLPADQMLNGTDGAHVAAISPDGTQLVYVAWPSGLYRRLMTEWEAKPIPGTEATAGIREPVFSPDGRSIAFFAAEDQELRKIDATGGVVKPICPAETLTGMSWGRDGIVFGQGANGIWRVSPDGSAATKIVSVKANEVASGPQMLPDGQHVLFTLASATGSDRWDKAHIVVQSLTSDEPTILIKGGSDAHYIQTGHLVYAISGSLHAIAFDLDRLKTEGNSSPILEGVSRTAGTTSPHGATGGANFSISDTGTLVYVPGPVSIWAELRGIGLADPQGKVDMLKLPAGPYAVPRASPKGDRIVFGTDDVKNGVVSIYDLSGKTSIERLRAAGSNRFPIWTRDGNRIVFQSDQKGDKAIFWQAADNTGGAEQLTRPGQGESHAPESWHPTSDVLLYSITKGKDVSLATLSLLDKTAKAFGPVRGSPIGAVFSPDGRWVAYGSTEGRRTTIYVQPYPATGEPPHQILSPDSPHHPLWSVDGEGLFYNPRPHAFEYVTVTTQPAFKFGMPEWLQFKKEFNGGPPASPRPYDIVRTGKFSGLIVGLFPMGNTESVLGSATQIAVVLNWFEELKAKMAGK